MMTQTAPGIERIQQIEFRAMGSEILAAVEAEDPEAGALLAEVPRWFAEWEQVLTRFDLNSELSRLNQTGGGPPVPISATLWSVLQQAVQAAAATDGLVTPTMLNALEAAGYAAGFTALWRDGATGAPAHPASAVANWCEIRMDPITRTVRLPAGLRLDLGGIAKGWAADEAVRRLAAGGPALVNAGGDIAVSGPLHDGGWPIGVDAPAGLAIMLGNPLALLDIPAGGVATSGRDYRRWQQDGAWRHHIIDPRRGSPATTDVLTATVIAPTASAAEVGAKMALLLGGTAGLAWLDARPALAGLLVLDTGQVLRSRELPAYLWS